MRYDSYNAYTTSETTWSGNRYEKGITLVVGTTRQTEKMWRSPTKPSGLYYLACKNGNETKSNSEKFWSYVQILLNKSVGRHNFVKHVPILWEPNAHVQNEVNIPTLRNVGQRVAQDESVQKTNTKGVGSEKWEEYKGIVAEAYKTLTKISEKFTEESRESYK